MVGIITRGSEILFLFYRMQSLWMYNRKSHLSLGHRSINYYIYTIVITCIEWLLASVLFYWVGAKNTKAHAIDGD